MADEPQRSISTPLGGVRQQHTLQGPRTLWALAVLAMVLDLASTWFGLSLGLTERNGLARLFIQEFGLLVAGLLLKGFTLLLGYAGWRILPALGPDTGRHRNLVPFAVALPSWAAAGINTATILAIL